MGICDEWKVIIAVQAKKFVDEINKESVRPEEARSLRRLEGYIHICLLHI
jgi:hypothetical protein